MPAIRFEPDSPARYDRAQLALRVLVMMLLAVVGAPLGWVFLLLYLGLPAVAAAMISGLGAARYRDEAGPKLVRGLRWLLALYAYLGLLTDRPPTSADALGIRFDVDRSGTPSMGGALLRLLTSIPIALVLCLLGFVSALLWLAGAIAILASRTCPAIVLDFQRGLLRMFARFLAHHASLVAGAAPLRFDAGHESALEAHSPAATA